jgi:hypothetical protein
MGFVTKACLNCGSSFQANTSYIKRGHAKFCCRSCSSYYNAGMRGPRPNVKCALCGKSIYRNPSKKKNSRSGLYFCCREHKDQAQRIGGIQAIQPPHYGTGNGEHVYREQALRDLPHHCNRCGWSKHRAVLVVHHKNRDRTDNHPENLEILCPNCHAWEHHPSNPDQEIPEPRQDLDFGSLSVFFET